MSGKLLVGMALGWAACALYTKTKKATTLVGGMSAAPALIGASSRPPKPPDPFWQARQRRRIAEDLGRARARALLARGQAHPAPWTDDELRLMSDVGLIEPIARTRTGVTVYRFTAAGRILRGK